MLEKLNSKDIRFIIACVVITLVCGFIGKTYFTDAFPQAKMTLTVTKDEATESAIHFLSNRGYDLSEYYHGSRWGYWNLAKVYLEKELGIEKGSEVFNEIESYRWKDRWFIPGQFEEFKSSYSTSGKLKYFEHVVTDSLPGESLSKTSALSLASFFLTGSLDWDLDNWELIEHQIELQKNRTDHELTWKKKNYELSKGGEHRIDLKIKGGDIAYYNDHVHVPESFEREYKNIRSKNDLLGNMGGGLLAISMFIILLTILIRAKKKDIRFDVAKKIGLVCFILLVLNSLNEIPFILYEISSNTSIWGLIFFSLFMKLIFIPGIFAIFIALLVAGAETYYRDNYGSQISFRFLFTQEGFRTKYFFNSVILGLTLTAFFFAYQTIFYIVANAKGAWSPGEVKNLNQLGYIVPWVSIIIGGFFPAIMEEAISRMFSIPFFHKLFKSIVPAVIISAVIWGLGHAGYPAQPAYIRVLEVGLGGIFIGWIFLKFGILPALIWHFSVDAFYSSFIYFNSGNTYYVISGLIAAGIFFIPLAYSIYAYRVTGGFILSNSMLNSLDNTTLLEEPEETSKTSQISSAFNPLSHKVKKISLAVFVIGIITMIYQYQPVFGLSNLENKHLGQWNIPKDDAYILAKDFLEKQNIDLTDHYHIISKWSHIQDYSIDENMNKVRGGNVSITFNTSAIEFKDYLNEYGGMEAIHSVYKEHLAPYYWNVRFFKPLTEREYNIGIDSRNGDLYSFYMHTADTSHISSLSRDEALQLITQELENEWDVNLADYTIFKEESKERLSRTDHFFTFQTEPKFGEARYTFDTAVHGNIISKIYRGLKIPQEWTIEKSKGTMINYLFIIIAVIIFLSLIILSLMSLFQLFKTESFNWIAMLKLTLIYVLISTSVDVFNSLSKTLYSGYQTSINLSTHINSQIISAFTSFGTGLLFFLVLFSTFKMFWPNFTRSFKKKHRSQYLSDCVHSNMFTFGICLFVPFVLKFILQLIFPEWINSIFYKSPLQDTIIGVSFLWKTLFAGTLFIIIVISSIYYIHRKYFASNNILKYLVFILFSFMIFLVGINGPGDLINQKIPDAIFDIISWFWVLILLFKYIWNENPWSFVCGFFIFHNIDSILNYLMSVNVYPGLYGIYMALLLVIAFYGWISYHGMKNKPNTQLNT